MREIRLPICLQLVKLFSADGWSAVNEAMSPLSMNPDQIINLEDRNGWLAPFPQFYFD
jgi:hypothetical protein